MADVFEDVAAVDQVVFPWFDVVSVCAPRQEDALHNDAEEKHRHHYNPHLASHSQRHQQLVHGAKSRSNCV